MQGELLAEDSSESSIEPHRGGHCAPHSPVLLTGRLVLRAPHEDDIDALTCLANNRKIATMVSRMPHPYTVHDAVNFVRRTHAGESGKCVYAITHARNGAFLGCCRVEPQRDGHSVEIGYWLGEPYWNQGYMTEVAHAIIDMVFRSDPDATYIDARCRVTNVGSRRVLQKCGFQFQSSELAASLALRSHIAVEWYRLDRKTWLSLRSWGHLS